MVNCMTAADGVKLRSQEVVQYSTSRTAAVTTVGRSKPAVASPYACYLATGGCPSRPAFYSCEATASGLRAQNFRCASLKSLLGPWYLAGCCFESAVKAFCNSRKSRQRQAFARNQESRAKRSPFNSPRLFLQPALPLAAAPRPVSSRTRNWNPLSPPNESSAPVGAYKGLESEVARS